MKLRRFYVVGIGALVALLTAFMQGPADAVRELVPVSELVSYLIVAGGSGIAALWVTNKALSFGETQNDQDTEGPVGRVGPLC